MLELPVWHGAITRIKDVHRCTNCLLLSLIMRRLEHILVTVLDLLSLLLYQGVEGLQIWVIAICIHSIVVDLALFGFVSVVLLDVLLRLVECLRDHRHVSRCLLT